MYKTDVFISAEEIKEIVGISKSKAYSLIQELNAELKEKGYLTVTGRVSRKHFEEPWRIRHIPIWHLKV